MENIEACPEDCQYRYRGQTEGGTQVRCEAKDGATFMQGYFTDEHRTQGRREIDGINPCRASRWPVQHWRSGGPRKE